MATREWTAEEEVQLFHALEGLKPVGINKHFYMACIADRLSKSLNREIPGEYIWAHLRTLYNLEALDELEPLPFPNDETEFSIPDEYMTLHSGKKRIEEKNDKNNIDIDLPSIIAVATDNIGKDKTLTSNKNYASQQQQSGKDKEKATPKAEVPVKRSQKRTRNNTSSDQHSSPRGTPTPPPIQSNKRRRI